MKPGGWTKADWKAKEVGMSDYNAVVIGAGNAGLTAATGLARSGMKILLLERHNVPGGCATSFTRGRFEFEVALHQLSGLGTDEAPGPLRQMLEELGVFSKLELTAEEELYRFHMPGEVDLIIPANREEAIRTLVSAFPGQNKAVRDFFDLVYAIVPQATFAQGAIGEAANYETAKEHFPLYLEYSLVNAKDVLDRYFDDERIKAALAAYWGYLGQPPSRMPFTNLALLLWVYIEMKPYHLKGGSQALSSALLDTFLEAGGEVRFNCGARKILVEDGRAIGVVTEQGDEILAEHVVSNASSLVTYGQLVDPAHIPSSVFKGYASRPIGISAVTAYIGLDCNPEDLGFTASTTFISQSLDEDEIFQRSRTLERPLAAGISCYDFADPGFSPDGSCHVSVIGLQYAEPWQQVPPENYCDEKHRYADHLIDIAEGSYPGIRDVIEEIEVATPITHMRYLGHPGGAIYGFDQVKTESGLFHRDEDVIQNLHLTGSWVGMGGFQPTLHAGRAVAAHITRQNSAGGI